MRAHALRLHQPYRGLPISCKYQFTNIKIPYHNTIPGRWAIVIVMRRQMKWYMISFCFSQNNENSPFPSPLHLEERIKTCFSRTKRRMWKDANVLYNYTIIHRYSATGDRVKRRTNIPLLWWQYFRIMIGIGRATIIHATSLFQETLSFVDMVNRFGAHTDALFPTHTHEAIIYPHNHSLFDAVAG